MAGWSADQLVSQAQKQYAAKNRAPAVDFALQALKLTPDHAGAIDLLQSMRNAAAATAADASRRAGSAGITNANSSRFREGRAKEASARALKAPGDIKAALGLYDAAAAAYGSASIDAIPGSTSTPPPPPAGDAPTPAVIVQGHLQRAEERLAAGDTTGATNAIREAEKIDPANVRVAELKKLVEARRTPAVIAPRPGEIEKVISDAERMKNDVDAIKFLAEQQGKYPGNADLAAALGNRQQARDNRINDLVQRARGANDEKAVEYLDAALTYNPARTDLRDERERRYRGATRVQTEKSVKDTLGKFEAAFEARSVAQFINIATYRTAMDIEHEFQAYRSIRMDIEGVTIAVQPDGVAAVTCTIRTVREPAGIKGKAITDSRPWRLKLANTGGAWRIVEAAPAP